MKIEVEVPDWAGENEIYILSSMELVAKKSVNQNWLVKTGRCHSCGICCGRGKADACEHLYQKDKDTWQCKYGIMRPFACCVCHLPIPEGCTEELKEIK